MKKIQVRCIESKCADVVAVMNMEVEEISGEEIARGFRKDMMDHVGDRVPEGATFEVKSLVQGAEGEYVFTMDMGVVNNGIHHTGFLIAGFIYEQS